MQGAGPPYAHRYIFRKSFPPRDGRCSSELRDPIAKQTTKSMKAIALLFKKPELFKIGARSSELERAEEHRCVVGGPPPRLHLVLENLIHLHEMTHM